MRLRIPRDSFLVFTTPSTLYALLGGVGAALVVGVVDGVALSLDGGIGAGDGGLQGWGGGQMELMSRKFLGLKLSVVSICHRWESAPMF